MTWLDSSTVKTLFSIGCITVIEMYAIYQGVNGVALAAVIGALAGLGGFVLGKKT